MPRITLLLCGAALMGFAGPASQSLGQPAQPNVVVIVSDDAGYADFGFMNQFTGQTTQFKTPNLDQLAQQSVVFSNGYVSSPLCAPSRAGLLTGRNQQRFGFEQNIPNNSPYGVPTSEVTIAERMKGLGYSTAAVGKWHIGVNPAEVPNSQGFDEFFGFLDGSREYFSTPSTPAIYRNGAIDTTWQNQPSFNGIPNDPSLGRYVTDAFGDEASKFIANHAADSNPFFLYLPFNAPHQPIHAPKASDLAQFSGTTLSTTEKQAASLEYGMDRNIGEVLSRLNDPNRDGNTSDSIRNNTIVIFVNDNGGVEPSVSGSTQNNGPLRDYKGSHWEGGVRVPYMISAPGVAPRIVNDMVSSLDILPTAVAAGGGGTVTPTDGVNLLPYLTGAQTGPIHEALFWRMGVDGFAVRKGDWKLAKGRSGSPIELYHLNANGSGETVDVAAANPEKMQELIRDFVGWESTVDKLKWTNTVTLNRFDEFVMRNDLTTSFNWRWGGGWRDNQNLLTSATLQRYDAAPNTVLIFETRDDANYSSFNNLERAVSHADIGIPTPAGLKEFMLNEVRLRGNSAAATNRTATLQGNALMLVDNLTGRQARITIDANRSAAANYTFNINMDLVLLHDTLISGNGTAALNIGGVIRDFYTPRSIIKEGTSKVTFSAHNTYAGETIVRGGELTVAATGAIDGSSLVHVQNGGTLKLAGGLIDADQVTIDDGATLAFTGGNLTTGEFTKASTGVFDWQSGQLKLTGSEPLIIGLTGPLGASVALTAGKGLNVASETTVYEGGALTVNGGTFATTLLEIDGGAFTAPNLNGVGSVRFLSGSMVLTQGATGNVQVGGAGGVVGSAGSVTGPGGVITTEVLLAAGDSWTVPGVTTLPVGARLSNHGGTVSTGVLHLDGGKYKAANLDGIGALDFDAGTLSFTEDLSIAASGELGANVTVLDNQTIEVGHNLTVGFGAKSGNLTANAGGEVFVGGATTIDALGSLTLNGGTIHTGSLGRSIGGTFTWHSGTLELGDSLTIAADGPLGGSVELGAGKILEVDGATTVAIDGSLTLSGGSLKTDQLVAEGAVNWLTGSIEISGPGGLEVGSGGPLGSAVLIEAGDALNVHATTLVSTGGSLTVAGGSFATGQLYLAGGSYSAASLAGVGSLNFGAGSLALTGPGAFTIGAGGNILGDSITLAAGDSLAVAGKTALTAGGSLTVVGGVLATGELELTGGTFTAASLAGITTLDFQSGTIAFTDDLTIGTGGDLGAAVTLAANQHVVVADTTTIAATGSLTLAGGSLSTGSFVAVAGSVFDWQSGALSLTGPGGLTVGAAGPLGAAVTLGAGRTLNVTAVTTLGAGASLTESAGQFTSGGVDLAGGALTVQTLTDLGSVNFQSGDLTVTGPGGVALGPGEALPATLALDATRRMNVTAATTLNAGSELTVADAAFHTGVLKLNGGSYSAANLTGVGALEFVAGSLTLSGSDGLTIGAGGPVSSITLATGDALSVPGTTQITAGGQLTLAGGALTTNTVAINGGAYAVADLSNPATVQFNVGTLAFAGDATIAAASPLQQVLGGQLTVGVGRRLTVAGAATLLAPLRLGGGRLTVGTLVNPAMLDFDAGTLDLTSTDLAVDAGGIWGSAVTVRSGTTLNIGQTTTVANAGLLEVQNNGRFGSTTLVNHGELRLESGTAQIDAGTLANNGMLRGHGRVDGAVTNYATGNVTTGAGQRLQFLGATFENAGHMSALGSAVASAELELAGVTTNEIGTGLITGAHSQLRFEGGLINEGSVALSAGDNHIHGAIKNTGDIVVTGGAHATFYGDVEQNGTLQVSQVGDTKSTAVFLGAVTGAGGVTGGGEVFFEGDLRPGNSPAQVNYAANVFLGGGTTLQMELGGTVPGVQYDQIVVTGALTLGGSLEVALIDAFTPTADQQFMLATATAGITGAFNSIVLPSLNGLAWAVDQTPTSLSVRLTTAHADFNGDGRVDGADFLAWQRGVGRVSAGLADGDGNGDGHVDGADLAIWKSAAFSGGGGAAAALGAVPEPTAALLAIVALIAGTAHRRRR